MPSLPNAPKDHYPFLPDRFGLSYEVPHEHTARSCRQIALAVVLERSADRTRAAPGQDVWLTTRDGVKLHSWLCHPSPKPLPAAPTIVFFQACGTRLRRAARPSSLGDTRPLAFPSHLAPSASFHPRYQFPPPPPPAQENAGNISHRLQNIKYFVDQLACNVFILSYRGYGKSGGKPNEAVRGPAHSASSGRLPGAL